MNQQNDRKTRTTTDKVEYASLGHLGYLYEVAEWYKTGRYSCVKDEAKSEDYLNAARIGLESEKIYFDELELINFKGITSTQPRINLDPNLNVFVGVNGSGKTSIIDSIVKVTSWLVYGIRNNANGKSIEISEINNHPNNKDCFIKAKLRIGDKSDFNIELFKSKNKSTKLKSELAEFKNISEAYGYFNDVDYDNFPLPLFAHYSVSRALDIKDEHGKRDSEEIVFQNKLDGYANFSENNHNFKKLLEWLTQHDFVNKEDVVKKTEFTVATAEYNTTKKIYDSLTQDLKEHADVGKPLETKLIELRKQIELLIPSQDNDDDEVRAVKDAIYAFMDIKNIRMEVTKESMSILMEKNNITISAMDLSQGEKALFSLVSDITRRLILLNPNKDFDARNGFGIVTIDEIDLHLHPKWQQDIVLQLTKVFPNIQFILTTHSPQVISTIPNYCVKVLNSDDDGKLRISEPEFSLGSESKMILEDIFLVDSRPSNVEEVQKLGRYKELIRADNWDTEEAERLELELAKWAGEHDPVMKQLKMDVRLRKRRRGTAFNEKN